MEPVWGHPKYSIYQLVLKGDKQLSASLSFSHFHFQQSVALGRVLIFTLF